MRILLLMPVWLLVTYISCTHTDKSGRIITSGSIAGDALSGITHNNALDARVKQHQYNRDTGKYVIVIKREADVRMAPSENADKSDNFYAEEGTRLKVINETADWYGTQFAIEDKIDTAYVRKSDVEDESSFPLTDYALNDGTPNVPELPLSEMIEVVRVDSARFKSLLQSGQQTQYIVPSKTAYYKDGELILPTKHGVKTYRNEKSDTYNTTFDCSGEIPALNCYLIEMMCSECEEFSYYLVNKSSGTVTVFGSIPYLSKDRKSIIQIENSYDPNIHNYSAYVGFYTLKNDSIVSLAGKQFNQWAATTSQEGFWDDEGWYYTTIISSENNMNQYPDTDNSMHMLKYVKIRLASER